MAPRSVRRHSHALAGTALVLLAAPSALAQEATRDGGRLGAALLGGFGSVSGGRADAASLPLAGVTLRFGGAFTDRFHLLGEFTLAAMPGGDVSGLGSVTAFHAALGLAGQVYLGPRFFLRGGVGAGWATATNGNTWFLPLPGPRFSWALGYDLWRRGEQSFSLALEGSYTILFNGASVFDRLFTLGLGVGFDWY